MNSQSKKQQKRDYLIFSKWGRKSYSLFSTLSRVVKISVLSVAYFLSVPVMSNGMERDTAEVQMQFDLDEVEVTASRVPLLYSQVARVLSVIESQEIEQAPVESIQELLEYVAGVDIRQRGAEGVQADISIRGGTFDQTLILLNGINITDPQTGHHNLNLPVSLSQIERIEILEGPAARVYGPNAFSGAINIVTRQPGEKSISAQFGAGSFDYINSSLSGGFKTGSFNHLIAGNLKNSSGYIDNTDFGMYNLFYSGQLVSNAGNLEIQAGVSDKEFGANSFYTPVYPNQYEETQTYFSSAKWKSENKFNLSPAVYWRRHSDKFLLFRGEAPEWYSNHNYHQTDILGISVNSWFLWTAGKTAFGAEHRSENIRSNVLGELLDEPLEVPNEEAFFTRSKNRNITSVFFEHAYYYKNWGVTAGVMGNYISDNESGINFFPGIDASYQAASFMKLVASWNTSLRMPTFTDLYYNGPTNRGNPDLKPEKTSALEGGLKFNTKLMKAHAIFFHRRGTNLIDWVKNDDAELWQSMNHTEVTSQGAEINILFFLREHFKGKWPNRLNVSYLYNKQDKMDSELISNYVLDNIRHKFVGSVNQPVSKRFSLDVKIIYQDREGSFSLYKTGMPAIQTAYESFWLTDTKMMYQLQNIQMYVSVNNLFDRNYFDLGNVVQPGRWIKAGISYKLKYN